MSHRGKDIYGPFPGCSAVSWVGGSLEKRVSLYNESIADIPGFWSSIASTFHWEKAWSEVVSHNFDSRNGPIYAKWFDGGLTNVCYNALDRWLPEHANQVAFFFEGNDVGDTSHMTYGEMFEEVTRLASVLKNHYGVAKGDRVSLYLPMIYIGPIAMLACARIGAVCSVVFGGFSAHSLAARLLDSTSKVLITAEGTFRGEKPIKLKHIADEALASCESEGVHCKCLVYERHGRDGVPMTQGRDEWYQDLRDVYAPDRSIEWVESEHPLFMLYTSGSTGKPKGLVHTSGGYMVYAATTFKYVFDYHPDNHDVWFCTADIGWITGHTYVVFGPLLNRATSVLFEGLPTHPTCSRWWSIVDKYKVTQFYTAPTAIRALMKAGEEPVKQTSRATLRVLGSVGEPINVAAWEWYYKVIGEEHCDIIDSWWQTETGGIMITPLPGTTPLKPGSATLPFFGIAPAILDPKTDALLMGGEAEGLLCIAHPWPGMARTIFGDHERFEQTYFSHLGFYFSGDGCRRDAEGYYWLTGRVDDVLNVSGHRLGTSEIECAVNTNPSVVESAVVGIPHDIKGEGIYVYVTFKAGVEVTHELLTSIKATCRDYIGPLATPDAIQPAHGLPKTRSGKIMRRILRKIAVGEIEDLGDVSTLADPHVVQELIELRSKWVLKK